MRHEIQIRLLPQADSNGAIGILGRLDEQGCCPHFRFFFSGLLILMPYLAIVRPRLPGQPFCDRRARIRGEGPALLRSGPLLLAHDLKGGFYVVVDDEVGVSADQIAAFGGVERSEPRPCVPLKSPKHFLREHPVAFGEGPSFILRLSCGIGVEEHRIEIHVVGGAAQGQRQGRAGIDTQPSKKTAHFGRIAAGAVIRVEQTPKPREGHPVLRQIDDAGVEVVGELDGGKERLRDEERVLRGLQERAPPVRRDRPVRVEPARGQLEIRRADDPARVGGEDERRPAGQPECTRLGRTERGDGGMVRDDAIVLEADGSGVIFAICPQRPQRVATAGIARDPAIDVPGLRSPSEHLPESAGCRSLRREDHACVVTRVSDLDHLCSILNTLFCQFPVCTIRFGSSPPLMSRN